MNMNRVKQELRLDLPSGSPVGVPTHYVQTVVIIIKLRSPDIWRVNFCSCIYFLLIFACTVSRMSVGVALIGSGEYTLDFNPFAT